MNQSLDIVIPAFNAFNSIDNTLNAIFEQTLPDNLKLGVIVVNNLSTDGTAERINQWLARGVRRIDYPDEQGRAASINAGVAASSADHVMILDADCCLIGYETLCEIGKNIELGIVAGFGYTTSDSRDFWGSYHRLLEARRKEADWQGWTTACCIIRRDIFNQIGGFSNSYRHYGFEDRDFICRLRQALDTKSMVSLQRLQANHNDQQSVANISKKMYQSGRYSSLQFNSDFPEAYSQTDYWHIDYKYASLPTRLCLRTLVCTGPFLPWVTEKLIQQQWLPIAFRGAIVKACSAVSFYEGSLHREMQR